MTAAEPNELPGSSPSAPVEPAQPIAQPPSVEVANQLIAKFAASMYRGPIPPPEVLRGYEGLVPGAAKRMLDMAERQGEHRMSLERRVVGSDIQRSWAGLVCATIVSLAVIALAGVLAMNGNTLAGTILAGVDIASLVGAFVWGTREQRLERERKAEVMAEASRPPEGHAVGMDVAEAQLERRRGAR